jgi:hypothetical protein
LVNDCPFTFAKKTKINLNNKDREWNGIENGPVYRVAT